MSGMGKSLCSTHSLLKKRRTTECLSKLRLIYLMKTDLWNSKMAQQLKALAIQKPETCWIPEPTVEGELTPESCLLTSTVAHMHILTLIK